MALAVLVASLLAAACLGFSGRNLAPPQFQVTQHGLLAPVNYPLWRRMSDWLAGRKYIMLTFDDGPYGHGVDKKILSILADHHAHAAFFEVCEHIDSATRQVPKLIVTSGNVLADHTYDHEYLPKLGTRSLQFQIVGCSSELSAISGVSPRLFRPPWGESSSAADKIIHNAHMQVVYWDANSGDTWLKSPQKIIRIALYEASLGGHILLMHSRPTTARALDELLTKLQARGYRFVLPAVGSGSGHMVPPG